MLIEKTINEPSELTMEAAAAVEAIVMQKLAEKRAEELMIARSFGMARPPKQRAGITTNKSKGTPKARRKLAEKSRRINRKAA